MCVVIFCSLFTRYELFSSNFLFAVTNEWCFMSKNEARNNQCAIKSGTRLEIDRIKNVSQQRSRVHYSCNACMQVSIYAMKNGNRKYYARKYMKCANLLHLSSQRTQFNKMFAYKTNVLTYNSDGDMVKGNGTTIATWRRLLSLSRPGIKRIWFENTWRLYILLLIVRCMQIDSHAFETQRKTILQICSKLRIKM